MLIESTLGENISVPIETRIHPRARRMTLRIDQARGRVVLTLPKGCRRNEAIAFVRRHQDWLRESLAALPAAVPFEDGALIPLEGRMHRLVFGARRRRGGTSAGVVWIEASRGGRGRPRLCVAGAPEHGSRRLRDWLVDRARKRLSARVRVHAQRLRLSPRRISVRDQTTRWGSCSTSGTLSFSWRLILAPPFVLDYVAAHEVAHLAEMNHGPRFWRLVRKTMPQMDRARMWLREHGIELHRYGLERH